MRRHTSSRARRGSALISAVIFAAIISALMAGIATLTVSQFSRASMEGDYAGALDIAEAGINTEYNKISVQASNADLTDTNHPNGQTYSFGSGTYTVYCAQKGTTSNWDESSNTLDVYCTGTLHGVSRTVKVSCKGYNNSGGNYAIFAFNLFTSNNDPTVNGNVGTNGDIDFTNMPTINGTVSFNGSGSGWSAPPALSYTTQSNPNPVVWPTIDQIAVQTFGSSGFSYVTTHNDNATATPPIVGNSVVNQSETFVGKPGGSNYYLTQISETNSSQVFTFNNTNGPINIWIGPEGATSGQCTLTGGAQTAVTLANGSNAARMYVATQYGLKLTGSGTINFGIYAYNQNPSYNSGNPFGLADITNNNTFNGSIIAQTLDITNNPTINYEQGYFTPTNGTPGYYGFDNTWQETGGVN